MLLRIDRHNGVPAYRQLMDQIRFQVASGVLAPGSELPSTRGLAADLGLNPMTVSKAYGLLEKEGVAVRRPGRPLVVGGDAPAGGAGARREELEKALEAAARVARQLGFDEEEALEAFARALRRGKES